MASAGAAAATNASPSASSSIPHFLEKHSSKIALGIIVALFIIANVCAVYGVFPGAQGSLIVGATLLSGSIVVHLIRLKFCPRTSKICALASLASNIALGVLGILNILPAQTIGLSALVTSTGISYIHRLTNAANQGNKKLALICTLSIALLALNTLGVTGVISGEGARLGLGLSNMVGVATIVGCKYSMCNDKDPRRKYYLLALIPAAILGGLGVYGILATPILGSSMMIASKGDNLFQEGVDEFYKSKAASVQEGQK